MNKEIRTKAKFENGLLKPEEPIGLSSGDEVELIIIKEEHLSNSDLQELAAQNPSFDFLNNKEEDIYSVEDLRKRYKK